MSICRSWSRAAIRSETAAPSLTPETCPIECPRDHPACRGIVGALPSARSGPPVDEAQNALTAGATHTDRNAAMRAPDTYLPRRRISRAIGAGTNPRKKQPGLYGFLSIPKRLWTEAQRARAHSCRPRRE